MITRTCMVVTTKWLSLLRSRASCYTQLQLVQYRQWLGVGWANTVSWFTGLSLISLFFCTKLEVDFRFTKENELLLLLAGLERF
jgi:hypothetical protein